MRPIIDGTRLFPPRRGDSLRRWCVPTALIHNLDGAEAMEGTSILEDVPGAKGLLLWQTYRDVLLWSASSAETPNELFTPDALSNREALIQAAAFAEEPAVALRVLASLLRIKPRREVAPQQVRRACSTIADWALSLRATRTAIAFAQAAAAACPAESRAALKVGRMAATHGRSAFADSWLARGIALARREGDWSTYGSAYVELARLAERDRQLRRARARFTRALRVGRRYGDSELRAHACYGLLRIASAANEYDAGERFARAALRHFGRSHPLRATVLHDYADLVLKRGVAGASDVIEAGCQAVQLLASIIPERATEPERITSLLLLVRAATHAQQPDVVENAWFDAIAAIELLGETREAARHLMELARTTAEVLEARRADELAQRAHSVAVRVNDRALMAEVSSFLARPRWRAAS